MTPASPAQRCALAAALRDLGAPPTVAQQLAATATLERDRDVLVLCLLGTCAGVDDDQDTDPCGGLAENAAADNAEAVDRQRRGEPGWTPWWPLPGRQQRR